MATSKHMARRDLLRLGGAAAGAAALAACGATPTPQVVEKVVTQVVAGTPQVVKETVVVKETQLVEQTVIVEQQVTPAAPDLAGAVSMWAFPLTADDAASLWNPLAARFNQAYPNVKVSVELLPWTNRQEKMMTAFAGGTAPDIAYVNTDQVSLWGMNDVLVALDDVIPQEVWDDLYGDLQAGFMWEGKRLMYPTLLIAEGYLYNKTLFTEIGWDPEKAPETWDDLRALGPASKEKGYFVNYLNTADWEDFTQFLWQADGHYYSDDVTKVLLNTEPVVETLSFYKENFANGWVPREGAVGSREEAATVAAEYWIQQKQVLSGQADAHVVENTTQQNPDLSFGLCPVFKNKRQAGVGGAGCWGIFKGTKNLETTKAWLLWLIEPSQQGFYGSVTGYAPARKQASDFWAADPLLKKFYEMLLPYLESNQDINYFYYEAGTICAPHFQAAVLDMVPVEDALQAAQDELQVVVDDWNAKRQ